MVLDLQLLFHIIVILSDNIDFPNLLYRKMVDYSYHCSCIECDTINQNIKQHNPSNHLLNQYSICIRSTPAKSGNIPDSKLALFNSLNKHLLKNPPLWIISPPTYL